MSELEDGIVDLFFFSSSCFEVSLDLLFCLPFFDSNNKLYILRFVE